MVSCIVLPRRKLRKMVSILNLCPSHTEIFSKRRKIYSWLCERLELMWCALKTNANSKCSWQCFWFWSWTWLMNGRETETRREQKLDKDLLLHSDISKSSRNSENTSKSQLLSAKKDLGRLHCHLLLLLRNGVGRQSQKNVMPTAPSVPRRSPIQVLTRLNAA